MAVNSIALLFNHMQAHTLDLVFRNIDSVAVSDTGIQGIHYLKSCSSCL